MEGYGKTTYGAEWASEYDQIYAEAPTATIELLAELGLGGRVPELSIGTGRIALLLVARGIDITGMDISHEMVAGLRAISRYTAKCSAGGAGRLPTSHRSRPD